MTTTLEVDHSSLDVVASWFGQTLSKKRQLDSDHGNHKKCKKAKQRDTDRGGELKAADNCDRVHQSRTTVNTSGQGQTSTVSAFIQQKINKKLIKASHKKKESLVFKEDQRGKNETKAKYNKHKEDICLDEEEEEETKFDLISKTRKTPQTPVNPQTQKKRRKRKRKKKSSES